MRHRDSPGRRRYGTTGNWIGGRQFHVRRLEIPMDDALLVCGFQRLCDLLRKLERLGDRNRPPRNPLRQRLPFYPCQ